MPIVITGLREVRSALKEIGDADSSKEIRVALKAAADIVAADAKGRVPSRTGRAAGSIGSGTSGAKAFVKGGSGVPYYGWLDFGSRTPRHGNPRSKGPWSGSGHGPANGRFLYPAIDEKGPEVVTQLEEGINTIISRAGF